MLQARRPFVGSSIGGCSATATEARARSPASHRATKRRIKCLSNSYLIRCYIVVNELSGLTISRQVSKRGLLANPMRNALRLRLAQPSRGVGRLEIGPSGRPLFYTVRIARASAAGRWRLRHWQASVLPGYPQSRRRTLLCHGQPRSHSLSRAAQMTERFCGAIFAWRFASVLVWEACAEPASACLNDRLSRLKPPIQMQCAYAPIPEKPKWMRWRTYERKYEKWVDVVE